MGTIVHKVEGALERALSTFYTKRKSTESGEHAIHSSGASVSDVLKMFHVGDTTSTAWKDRAKDDPAYLEVLAEAQAAADRCAQPSCGGEATFRRQAAAAMGPNSPRSLQTSSSSTWSGAQPCHAPAQPNSSAGIQRLGATLEDEVLHAHPSLRHVGGILMPLETEGIGTAPGSPRSTIAVSAASPRGPSGTAGTSRRSSTGPMGGSMAGPSSPRPCALATPAMAPARGAAHSMPQSPAFTPAGAGWAGAAADGSDGSPGQSEAAGSWLLGAGSASARQHQPLQQQPSTSIRLPQIARSGAATGAGGTCAPPKVPPVPLLPPGSAAAIAHAHKPMTPDSLQRPACLTVVPVQPSVFGRPAAAAGADPWMPHASGASGSGGATSGRRDSLPAAAAAAAAQSPPLGVGSPRTQQAAGDPGTPRGQLHKRSSCSIDLDITEDAGRWFDAGDADYFNPDDQESLESIAHSAAALAVARVSGAGSGAFARRHNNAFGRSSMPDMTAVASLTSPPGCSPASSRSRGTRGSDSLLPRIAMSPGHMPTYLAAQPGAGPFGATGAAGSSSGAGSPPPQYCLLGTDTQGGPGADAKALPALPKDGVLERETAMLQVIDQQDAELRQRRHSVVLREKAAARRASTDALGGVLGDNDKSWRFAYR